MKSFYTHAYYLTTGLLLIILSVILFNHPPFFGKTIFQFLGIILTMKGTKDIFQLLLTKKQRTPLLSFSLFSTGSFLYFFPDIPFHLCLLVFSLYVGGLGIIKLITCFHCKKKEVPWTIFRLSSGLLLIFVSAALFSRHQPTMQSTTIFLALYSLGLGGMYLIDWQRLSFPLPKQFQRIKRHLRISPPIWLTALIPRFFLNRLDKNHLFLSPSNDIIDETCVQILIHVTPDGFGAIGHCDIVIDGLVFSYGNYDDFSTTLFESLGDGVLVTANIETYLPFCVNNNQKTIFLYTLSLTKRQKERIHKSLNDLRKTMEPWLPSHDVLPHKEGYAQKLTTQVQASLFKFKQGKFKKYFVLGCNCVDLVDQLVGPAGIDLIGVNGIVSPGAYQIYLEKEYHFKNGIVESRQVFRPVKGKGTSSTFAKII
ncbi:DUF308 domain-containing protein [Enterococcus sp. LJL98]